MYAWPSRHPDQCSRRFLGSIALEKLQGSSFRTLDNFSVTNDGLDCSSPSSSSLKPRTLPMMPGGFGTGQACAFFLIIAFSSSVICRGICFTVSDPGLSSIGASVVRRRRLLRLPSSTTSKSESANLTRGAGHGMICGMPTTRKDTRRVVPKREVVRRDRGWR